MFDNLVFDHIDTTSCYPIKCKVKCSDSGNIYAFNKYGHWNDYFNAKCVIFPKGKTTWEGFVPLYKFKGGDVIFKQNFIAIISYIEPNGRIWYHCWYNTKYKECKIKTDFGIGCINDGNEIRFATKKEKEILFKAIEENGYEWNEETKTLEKKLTFKDGDILYVDGNDDGDNDDRYKYVFIFKEIIKHNKEEMVGNKVIAHCWISNDYLSFHEPYLIDDTYCIRFATEEEKEKLFNAIQNHGYKWNTKTKTLEKLIKPKFKVGDKIVNDDYVVEIIDMDIEGEVYGYKSKVGVIGGILFIEQDEWELVPNKFDPTTLKPFTKVLTRCSSLEKWRIQFFEKYDKTCSLPFICLGHNKYKQCIPYKGNEHLLDTADSCSDYYQL